MIRMSLAATFFPQWEKGVSVVIELAFPSVTFLKNVLYGLLIETLVPACFHPISVRCHGT